MSLILRMAGIPEQGQDPIDVQKLGFEQVLAYVAEVDRAYIAASVAYTDLALTVEEQAEFNDFVALYGSKGNQSNKRAYLDELRQVFNMAELRVDGSGVNVGNPPAPGTDYTDPVSFIARINSI